MNGAELRPILIAALDVMPGHADELRRLDGAIGDGDLGVTVGGGAAAVGAALAAMPADASVAETVREAGQTFRKTNPSTFGALIGMSLTTAARSIGDDPLGPTEVAAFTRVFFETVAAKGKSALGDKTILDALGPAADALDRSIADGAGEDAMLDAMIVAAEEGIERSTPLTSKRGRARWLGDRSQGHQDPGAVALLRFLEALRGTLDRSA